MMERKIAIYSRKSKYTGKGESIENQIEMCKKKIRYEYDNINFDNDVIIYQDEGYTGYNTKRPSFQKLLKDIREDKIKTIVFYKLDRVSRNVNDFSNLLNELDKYDVKFFSVTENLENSTPTGRAMIMVVSIFAQLERDTIAERIRDNMIELAKTGRWLGGTTPLGYKSTFVETINTEGKKKKLFKLDIINEEINIIKTIFNKYVELKSQTKLETYLINNNIKTRKGNNFSRFAIKNILQNPVYAIGDADIYNYFEKNNVEFYNDKEKVNGEFGIMAYNKTEQKSNKSIKKNEMNEWVVALGKHKGIITGKDWVEAQEIMSKNEDKRFRASQRNNALLSGIIRCSYCGSFMRPKIRKEFYKDNELRFNYMCELKEKSRKGKCQVKDVCGNEIDRQVINAIKEVAKPSSNFYKLLKKTLSTKYSDDNSNKELDMLKSQYKRNETEINSLVERIPYIDITLIDDINVKIKQLKESNLNIEKDISKLTANDNNLNIINTKEHAQIVLDVIDNYIPRFNELNILQKRTLIKMLISSVKTDGKDLIIDFVGSRNKKDASLVPLCVDSK